MNDRTNAADHEGRLNQLRDDLRAEQLSLDDVLAPLTDEQWQLATPSPGWSVADQIAHLAFFDAAGTTAILHPDDFALDVTRLYEGATRLGYDEYTMGNFRSLNPAQQLDTWRHHRATLNDAAASLSEGDRLAWYGPSMGAVSFLTARLMETWAHGTDVANGLGVAREPTDRLRHVAQLGFMTRKWSYTVRGEDLPAGLVRLDLTSPMGEHWLWGLEDADDSVSGSAEEFCLVVTQRRHLDDTTLETGELGRHWLLRAQAFAGGPSQGPQTRST
jgi:uncharacterized protein (TIGR03084 family)